MPDGEYGLVAPAPAGSVSPSLLFAAADLRLGTVSALWRRGAGLAMIVYYVIATAALIAYLRSPHTN